MPELSAWLNETLGDPTAVGAGSWFQVFYWIAGAVIALIALAALRHKARSAKRLGWKSRTAIGVLALIGLVVWLTWPTSGIQLYIEQSVEEGGYAQRVHHIAGIATARTDRFIDHADYLTLQFDKAALANPVPGKQFGGALKPGDLVTLSLGITLKKDWLTFEGKFDLT